MAATPIALFARAPVPGRAKSRLGQAIGAERAAELAQSFVLDTLARCAEVGGLAPELHVDAEHPFFLSLGVPVVLQVEGDLGARMDHALGRAAMVLGTDAPTLPARTLQDALEADTDVVLTPVADGGYVLVRARPFFAGHPIRWSSRHALADTLRAAGSRSVRLTRPHYDVDELADLRLLATHLRLDPAQAPRTAALLVRFGF